MSIQNLQMGVTAVQNGALEEGARLLRLAISGTELTAPMRAAAYLWLAQTQADTAAKRASYQAALDADPTNDEIRTRVTQALAALTPPKLVSPPPPVSMPEIQPPQSTPPPMVLPEVPPVRATPPPAPVQPVTTQPFPTQSAPVQPRTARPMTNLTGTILDYLASVSGGANGTGTAFFPTAQPILVTTRYVTGGSEQLTVELQSGEQIVGQVVRSFSDFDLALIRVDVAPPAALPTMMQPRLSDDAPITIIAHGGAVQRAAHRPTNRAMPAHWIPTDATTLPDAGGGPVFDAQNFLVGMMTRSTSRVSDHYYGVYISLVQQCVNVYLNEINTTRVVYCPQCGTNSRAAGAGFFYCEICGGVMPGAEQIARYPIPQAENYYNPGHGVNCPVCQSTVGFHDGLCLRCGQAAPVSSSPYGYAQPSNSPLR